MMKRNIGVLLLALSMMAVATPLPEARAQWVNPGRSGVRYNAYGQGYYGSYGPGYTVYSPGSYTYSGYGNGPYLYGSGYNVPYQSNAGYGYGTRTYYNGYSYPVNSGQYYAPSYAPYGYVRPSAYGYSW